MSVWAINKTGPKSRINFLPVADFPSLSEAYLDPAEGQENKRPPENSASLRSLLYIVTVFLKCIQMTCFKAK